MWNFMRIIGCNNFLFDYSWNTVPWPMISVSVQQCGYPEGAAWTHKNGGRWTSSLVYFL